VETFSIVFENVNYVGPTIEEPVTMGNVLLAPMPPDPQFDESFEIGAIVRVAANTLEQAKRRASLLLANAVTVLTYALCRQAMPEGRDKSDVLVDMSIEEEEDVTIRKWREELQGAAKSSPDTDYNHVHVITVLRSLGWFPERPKGKLSESVSDPVAQKLLRILNDRQSSSLGEYAESLALAVTYLQRSMESEGAHSLIDAITGLEALFGPRGADLFYPIAATVGYGVAYTSAGRNDPEKCLETWKQVKDIYRDRSQLVHGDRLSISAQDAISDAERMLVESIEFCVRHERTILACHGIQQWLDMVRFGCRDALVPEETPSS